jgi:hypothetical protein
VSTLRKIRQPPPTQGEDRLIPFLASLVAEDLSPNTVDGYRRDLLAFRRWYRESRGTDLRWEKLNSNDLINYRQHLVAVERRRPATVNRCLQALRRFCRWARDGKILKADPGESIKSVRVSWPITTPWAFGSPTTSAVNSTSRPSCSSEEDVRRRVQLQLNRGESRHDLARWLFFANQGEFRTGDYEEIMNKASCLSLLSNAVLVWNTVRMGEIVARLRAAGEVVSDEDLARISPLAYAHVSPNGTYVFDHSRRGHIAPDTLL